MLTASEYVDDLNSLLDVAGIVPDNSLTKQVMQLADTHTVNSVDALLATWRMYGYSKQTLISALQRSAHGQAKGS
jgi:hypothetical protein